MMDRERNDYHVPALLDECLEALSLSPDGVYVDVTFGGGGHPYAAGFRVYEEYDEAVRELVTATDKALREVEQD